jgi:hypothetical protein
MTFALLPYMYYSRNDVFALILTSLVGAGIIPLIPLSMGFSSELTFPLPAPTTNGFLLMMGQVFGLILGLIQTKL